ncbi:MULTISPECIES: hypothetical protein [Moorena]|uniref:Uncharacterized protein n=1 Tax=Moorena producens 3L TaxID=489825 RepID=F4XR16_9CYAN|nr:MULTISPECIES: hypothetical protein [Moorena]EGJ32991.1 hypothetical protein LYNGBM3L_55720 [Moorena producens 3L]NEP68417.1 hypothetical protein [Moorena sp. SIO3A5]NEQ10196.1 hypothetical protein [Moorena sp. SIO4E2]NER91074.1 hypothetical protein [Moorena sp. SIO3A2]NES43760.1 hypothetical protein [Moorena sp. SIO2C4]
MTEFEPATTKSENYIEKPEDREKLEDWYRREKRLQVLIILILLALLIISSFGQLALLDYSFGERLALSKGDKIFGIETKNLLSLLVTGALPITSIVDGSGIISKKIKIPLPLTNGLSIIWLVLLGDIFLNFQAVLVSNESGAVDQLIPVIAFVVAIIFSTASLCLSRGIVAASKKFMAARKNLQILMVYGINPTPLYKDNEQLKLREENQAATTKAEQERKIVVEEINQHQEALELVIKLDKNKLKYPKIEANKTTKSIQAINQLLKTKLERLFSPNPKCIQNKKSINYGDKTAK